jgi:hypothetical protein
MDEQSPGVPELLAFVSDHPIESMEIHLGNGPVASIDLVCSDGARLIGVPLRYLNALEQRDLLPAEIIASLRSLSHSAIAP